MILSLLPLLLAATCSCKNPEIARVTTRTPETVQLVPAAVGIRIRLCSLKTVGDPNTLTPVSGTGVNCGHGTTDAYGFYAIGSGSGYLPTGAAFCIRNSRAMPMIAEVYFCRTTKTPPASSATRRLPKPRKLPQ